MLWRPAVGYTAGEDRNEVVVKGLDILAEDTHSNSGVASVYIDKGLDILAEDTHSNSGVASVYIDTDWAGNWPCKLFALGTTDRPSFVRSNRSIPVNTLRTGDADLRF